MRDLNFFDNFVFPISFELDPTLQVTYFVFILFLNLLSYFYVFLKFYKVLCYSKLTFEWLPMINPYHWPFSFFQLMTNPYFSFWSRVLPNIKLEKSSIEISAIVGLEALNAALFFCVRMTNILVLIIQDFEKTHTIV